MATVKTDEFTKDRRPQDRIHPNVALREMAELMGIEPSNVAGELAADVLEAFKKTQKKAKKKESSEGSRYG